MVNHDVVQRKIDKIRNGSIDDIIDGLNEGGGIYRMMALLQLGKKRQYNSEIVDLLKELKTDTTNVYGHRISTVSTAILHILDIEKYTGNDDQVIRAIKGLSECG